MKIARKKTNKKKIILIVTIVALLIGGASVYAYVNRQTSPPASETTRPMNDVDYSPPTEDNKKTVDDHKQELEKDQTPAQNEEPSTPTQTPTISLSVPGASQQSSGQPLHIRSVITGTSSGTCEVTLTKDGQTTIAKSFLVTFEATTARCADADIPASDFSASGTWRLKVIVKKDAQVSNVVEQNVEITK